MQAARGMGSFGETWGALAQNAARSQELADSLSENLFVYRVGDKIMGAMKISDAGNALTIKMLEGFGGGAGTELVKAAVQESIRRGYGGQIVLYAADYPQVISFYENLGFVLTDPLTNQYFLSAEAAMALIGQ